MYQRSGALESTKTSLVSSSSTEENDIGCLSDESDEVESGSMGMSLSCCSSTSSIVTFHTTVGREESLFQVLPLLCFIDDLVTGGIKTEEGMIGEREKIR